jgi:hypothetical protein
VTHVLKVALTLRVTQRNVVGGYVTRSVRATFSRELFMPVPRHHAAGKNGSGVWVVGAGVWILAPRTQHPKPKTFFKGGGEIGWQKTFLSIRC